ncbi:hypothetical protein [uncultured Fusobacterium sp.]|uniref:hypothetical protein n=1 Tax=uncultured Fusobacterium sp. TaxID=159267 RepID=UPI002600BA4A|nr:hypothetical protein [uncultured Fusobacterium sp.]
MNKNRGYTYLNIVVSILVILSLMYVGIIYYRNLKEKIEVDEAKQKIVNIFTDYSAKAFDNEKAHNIKIDYILKKIIIYENILKEREKIKLPASLKYATVYNKENVEKFEVKITRDGNITPSFSIYIFGYDDIARYRISFYGFDMIKFMKINVYKNIKNKKVKYKNIVSYHEKFAYEEDGWRKE